MLVAAAVVPRLKERRDMDRKHRRAHTPTVARTEDVPLREVSGICLRRRPAGVTRVVAIGDRAAVGAPPGAADAARRHVS
jgi:hypothetical protein